ncbi:hypothetical protein G7B40_003880 [Aetokthonos hydrillicola Thurmond2011]|jgi:hypothetical protein|uniref:Uncharacterized protein n=1 Tax=Aetokthonos hydrillicola Thurmond2011 TaxID=2712845 RepID=A0AAP5M8L4_9CYAN|nr:hypothetical protein [Aetokthonos hydrillicola]MBO3457422.1 hypothetical protein [Aetokthonos hydrillicola CCALA 1050]MBW4589437.1 hypothetical protein [Aetokthonos hydrillicola CCALA 1050]MDR9893718.1 hypothetical protein [Aetokthonos hydrillicola Thurmond2011]
MCPCIVWQFRRSFAFGVSPWERTRRELRYHPSRFLAPALVNFGRGWLRHCPKIHLTSESGTPDSDVRLLLVLAKSRSGYGVILLSSRHELRTPEQISRKDSDLGK